MADPSWRPLAGGVAQRRRERRLRSWYRHEQQTVRMALAAFSHHSALRRQMKARAGEEGHEEHDALRRQKPPPPQPELFSLEEEPGGGLPAPLSEVAGRQEVLVRHVVEHMADVCPLVQTLDALVPQMVDTVLEFFRSLDLPVDEQVIAVPKISTDRVSQRLVERRLPQIVEQLVEVPTVLTPTRIALRVAEQIVGTPVPRGLDRRRVQGFLPVQSSTATSSSGKRISERTVEQIVDIPSGVGLGHGSSSSACPAEEDFTGVFRTFPHGKKVRSAGQVSADLPRHVSSWTPAAYEQPSGSIEQEKYELLKREEQEKLNSLWAVPVECRTHQQMQRITFLLLKKTGAKKKRKKRRKKKLPKTSSSSRPRSSSTAAVACSWTLCSAATSSSSPTCSLCLSSTCGRCPCCAVRAVSTGAFLWFLRLPSREGFPVHFVCLCLPFERGFGICMDLADPVSSGSYSGTFVFSAPVAELTLVSFTVPLNGWTFAATAAVVTSCSSSADSLLQVYASLCRVVVVFFSWWCLRFCLGQCEAGDWKILLISSFKRSLGVYAC